MNRKAFLKTCALGLFAAAGSFVTAQDQKPGGQEMPLPAGWTMEDMQACMMAGTPGEMHAHLTKLAGVWHGKSRMWMGPDAAEPMQSECVQTITALMDGRYIQCVVEGEMPGMGMYHGMGFTGFDNVSQKFVGTWIDNHSTGILFGAGELSSDGKVSNWLFNYNCPITKKPTTMRQVETYTGADTMKLEMFNIEPKSGKEYKCMEIEFTRKGKVASAG